jgi:hypothetical protein
VLLLLSNNSDPTTEQIWYNRHFKKPNEMPEVTSPVLVIPGASTTKLSKKKTAKLVAKDEILKGLLKVLANETNSSAISKHYFHDALLEEKEIEEKGSSDQAVAGLKGKEQSVSTTTAMKGTEQTESTPRQELPSHEDKQSPKKRLSPSSNSSPDSAIIVMANASARRRLHLGSELSKASSVDYGASGETEVKDSGTLPSPSGSKRTLKRSNEQYATSLRPRKKVKPAEEDDILEFIKGKKQVLTPPSQESPKKNSFFPKRVLPKFLRGIITRKES